MEQQRFQVSSLTQHHISVCGDDSHIADYVHQQDEIERLHSSAAVHNDDFVGIASYNIFVGVAIATIFGAGFFFDLFFPERFEPKNIRWSWRISALVVTLMAFADAIALTVIVATGNAWISADSQDAADIALEKLSPPLQYRDNGRAIASVVFLWVGLVGTIARYVGKPPLQNLRTCIDFSSCIILWLYYNHLDTYGPKSHSARMRDDVDKTILTTERATTNQSYHQQAVHKMRNPRV